MVLPRLTPLSKSVRDTLVYFDKFDYPLTPKELWYWQSGTNFSRSEISAVLLKPSYYFYLKGRDRLVAVRQNRSLISQKKFKYAAPIIAALNHIPFISAIFITGALAMSNSPRDDDIDLMIITRKYTLWLTRPLVILYLKLKHLRRDPYLPEHASARVTDKICDNLWLDEEHLSLPDRSLFTAHELLQARCVYDRGGIYNRFITENSWAKDYLPVAFHESIKKLENFKIKELNNNWILKIENLILWPINLLLFSVQYLYMLPHLTSERVGLGYAFFHRQGPVYNT